MEQVEDFVPIILLKISESPAPACRCERSPCQTDKIPLLPPQPTHLSPARMCHTTGKTPPCSSKHQKLASMALLQVCNAVYVRLNWTQPLCACPSRYRDPCSASLNSDDQHTTELMTDRNSRVRHDFDLAGAKLSASCGFLYFQRALTLVKTCEPTTEMRVCRAPRDWSLLALQNIRTGKSHYLVICRCLESSILGESNTGLHNG